LTFELLGAFQKRKNLKEKLARGLMKYAVALKTKHFRDMALGTLPY